MSARGRKLLRTTPMRDLVRGRVTGRLDREAPTADLPDDVRDLVRTVVNRTRLWRLEKADLTRELAAHFRDGLDSGASADDLVAAFGDPKHAAKLIRRAKKRARPLPWQAFRYTRNAAAVVLALLTLSYTVLFIRYHAGEPKITRNYAAELNAPILAIPVEDRAWPIFIEAIANIPARPDRIAGESLHELGPDSDLWPDVVAYHQQIRPGLDMLIEALSMPSFGMPLSDARDPAFDRAVAIRHGDDPDAKPSESSINPIMMNILLPAFAEFREMARLLTFDATMALRSDDSDRYTADIQAMIGLASHCREHPFVISDMVGIAIFHVAIARTDEMLATNPDALPDRNLIELSHLIAGFGGGRVLPQFEGERAFFYDAIQRCYTDNGIGGGRFVSYSFLADHMFYGVDGAPSDPTIWDQLAEPIGAVAIAGRRETVERYEELLTRAERDAAGKPWERRRHPDAAEMDGMVPESINPRRFMLLEYAAPAFDPVVEVCYMSDQRRSATLTAIALELYKRRHGGYPATLDELVPDLLPSLPRDMFTGDVLGYLVTDDGPILYSRGVDRKDDGGRPPKGAEDPNHSAASRWLWPDEVAEILANPNRRDSIDGDWILYPPIERSIDE